MPALPTSCYLTSDDFDRPLAAAREALTRDLDSQTKVNQELLDLEAKFKDLDARAQEDLVAVGESWVYAPWTVDGYDALIQHENSAYEVICAEWWSASGPFHRWLKRYKEHLVEQTPHREETDDVGAGFMVIMISTPATTYRSTATLDAIDEHMGKAAQVFTRRRQWPKQLME